MLIIALGVRLGVHAGAAGSLELGVELLGDVLVDLLRDDLVFRVGLVQLLHDAVIADVERLGKDGRERLTLNVSGHAVLLLGLGHDRLGRYRDALDLGGLGEHLHVRVVDLAAVRGDEGIARLERRGLLDIEVVVEHLHIEQAHADQTEADDQKQRREHAQTHRHINSGLFFSHRKISSE